MKIPKTKAYIYPYKDGSQSAKALAQSLGSKRIKLEGSRFVPRPHRVVVNWGSSSMPLEYTQHRFLNHPVRVGTASDKLETMMCLYNNDVMHPRFRTKIEGAKEMLKDGPVVCRTVLNGHSGVGITIAKTEQELVAAPLYTQYIKKKSEWRVHIFLNEVIMVQQKVRGGDDRPPEEVNWMVRNHANGFIFQHKDINPPVCVIQQAAKAVSALSLDFGAVDVCYNEFKGEAYVLEVNCAPGLEGTTIERYKKAIESYLML